MGGGKDSEEDCDSKWSQAMRVVGKGVQVFEGMDLDWAVSRHVGVG